MKTILLTAFVSFCAFQIPVYAQDAKIGVVNPNNLISQSPQAQAMRSRLQDEFSDRRQELQEKQQQLQGMQERIQRDAAIMSQAERQELQRKVRRLQRDLQRDQEEFQEDLNIRRNEEMSQIQQEIVQAIRTVAKNNDYDLVVAQGVIHASDQVDITNLVLQHLNSSAQ